MNNKINICRKCKCSSSMVIRKEYYFCDDCFLSYIEHKFRACLGKNIKLSTSEKVLICLSGGQSSVTLLDLINNGISLHSHKKLRIEPYFLHITGTDECSNKEIITSILDQCQKYNSQVFMVDINHYFNPNNILSTLNLDQSQRKEWQRKVSSTTNNDLLTQIKQSLFIRVAKELHCKFVFTGESTTTLAVNLLSNLAIGRGSQIESNIGFCNKNDETVQILRPMRDITTEEIENYIHIRKLIAITNKHATNGLQSIIKDFVAGLQENFPSTLTTVCKTADKMCSETDPNDNKKCKLCKSIICNEDNKLTAAEATIFSSFVSSREHHIYSENITDVICPNLEKESLCYCCSKNVLELGKFGIHNMFLNN